MLVQIAANEAHPWVTLVVVMAVFVAAAITERLIGAR